MTPARDWIRYYHDDGRVKRIVSPDRALAVRVVYVGDVRYYTPSRGEETRCPRLRDAVRIEAARYDLAMTVANARETTGDALVPEEAPDAVAPTSRPEAGGVPWWVVAVAILGVFVFALCTGGL